MKKLLLLSIFLISAGVSRAADPEAYGTGKFDAENGVELNYRILLPDGYESGGDFPLVLFLHGGGERGDDNLLQLVHGSGMFSNPVNMERYPAVVIFPQCPEEYFWALESRPEGGFDPEIFPAQYPATAAVTAVKGLVDHFLASGRIDPARVYITGLSMGGMATFDMVCRWPGLFAAAVPICGGVHPDRLQAAAGVPFRIFHGDADDVVPVENSRNAYLALKKIGAEVEYIEFPGVTHASWVPAFNTPDFLEWMFSKRKK